MQRIIFQNRPDALNPNDYNIETCYQENKARDIICIANSLLLDRFRLGVKRKEIEPFKLTVEDIDYDPNDESGWNLYEETCKENGKLHEVWGSKILLVGDKLLRELI